MVKPNLKGPADLLRFRDSFGFKKSKDKEKKNSGLDISFGSSNRFGLTVLYCIKNFKQIGSKLTQVKKNKFLSNESDYNLKEFPPNILIF